MEEKEESEENREEGEAKEERTGISGIKSSILKCRNKKEMKIRNFEENQRNMI